MKIKRVREVPLTWSHNATELLQSPSLGTKLPPYTLLNEILEAFIVQGNFTSNPKIS